MIRSFFAASAFAATVFGSVLGSVYAWTSNANGIDVASVGENSALVFTNSVAAARIGPDGGPAVHVSNVIVQNTGAFPLQIQGTPTITIYDTDPLLPGGPSCAPTHFTGLATDVPSGTFSPGGISSPAFKVKIAANVGAPNDCQGDRVHYTVDVTVGNP